MPDYQTIATGGLRRLLTEAMPGCSSSTAIFANAPAGTRLVQLTLRTQGITMTFGAPIGSTYACNPITATASAIGHDYAPSTASAPYEFALSYDECQNIRAIQQAATATGYITYWGM